MKCFLHPSADAVGSCKSCCKGLCQACAGESGYGLSCGDACSTELRSLKDLMDKTRMMYGQTRGRIPLLPVLVIPMGLVFSIFGVISWTSSGRGWFPSVFGAIMLVVGIVAIVNQRRTGLRA